jgi:hypothetical protein
MEQADYRPITLPNADSKRLARILANRASYSLCGDALGQYCGVLGRIISDAIAVVRDTTAHAHLKIKPFCTLYLDFEAVFNEISHQ